MTAITPTDGAHTLDELLRETRGVTLAGLVAELDLGADEAVFWSGSRVEGFANPISDIDLYLLGDRPDAGGMPDATAPGFPDMAKIMLGGAMRMDITVVGEATLDAAAAYLADFRCGTSPPITFAPNFREFLHRLRIGVPVAHPERFAELRGRIDFDRFQRYLCCWYQNLVDTLHEDVQGLQLEGDLHSAYLVARQRLEAAVDLYLASRGETNTRVDKWRWKKLLRVHDADDRLVRRFLACEGMADAPAPLEQRIRDCLALTQQLLVTSV